MAAPPDVDIGRLRRVIRVSLALFIAGLVLSGLTAFPLLHEVELLCQWMGLPANIVAANYSGLSHWLLLVREGLANTYARYPFIAYGTDWLAFGHLVIALFFIAPFREPGRHRDVLRMGILACALVVPLAFICGPIRGIPFYWRLIDSSFGVVGIIPLAIALRTANRLQSLDHSVAS